MKILNWINQVKSSIIYFLLILLGFEFCYGLKIINPSNINWLMSAHHDWGQHYLGWAFFRYETWTFPLCAISNYNYPVGTNIGFMDAIPLMALIFKPFSSVLPDNFQYLGLWLFICSVLIAYYTKKILDLYNTTNWIILIAIIIMISNPVLLFRAIHPALSSHFLILGSIYNYLKISTSRAEKINLHQIVLFLIAASVHPYITVMVFGFNVIVPIKHYFFEKTISLKQLFLYPLVSLFGLVVIWTCIGLLEFNSETSVASVEPFSVYSFNLNSFFDSYGYYSKFIPDLGKVDPRQYEGFAYIGIGMMILISVCVIYLSILFLKKRIQIQSIKKTALLFVLCLLLFVFAITNVISFNKNIVATLPLPTIIEKLGFIFRASGRFVWPLYYLMFIGSIVIFARIKINENIKALLLAVVAIIQLYDIQELYTHWDFKQGEYTTPLQDQKWIHVMKQFDDIIVYPPFDYNYSINYTNDYQDIGFLALKAKKPISNGYVARANVIKAQVFNDNLKTELASGILKNKRLILTTEKNLKSFEVLLHKDAVDLHKMDDFIFIYNKNSFLKATDFSENLHTKHYLDSIKFHYKNVKIAVFEKIDYKINTSKTIKYNIEKFNFDKNIINTRGWAVIDGSNNNKDDKLFLVLQSEKGNLFAIECNSEKRPDITTYFGKENLDNAGFNSVFFTTSLLKGNYKVGILIKTALSEYYYTKSDKNILIK